MNARLLFTFVRSSVVILGLAALAAVPALASSGVVPLGPEIVVRNIPEPKFSTRQGFGEVSLAGHRDGSFAVAWVERDWVEGVDVHRVRMRRFDRLGRPGRAYLIDDNLDNLLETEVDAVSDGRGGQVVAWQRRTTLDQRIFNTKDTWVQFFPPGDGAPGPRRLVLTDTSIGQAITRLSAREFGIASRVLMPGFQGMVVGRFDRKGGLLAPPALFRRVEWPVLVTQPGGEMAVVFDKVNFLGIRRSDSQVMLQRIDLSGDFRGPRVAVGTLSPLLNEHGAGAAPLPGGGLVVVWQREGAAPETSFEFITQICMRRFDALGLPSSPITVVDGPVPLIQTTVGNAKVATDRLGRAVVVWRHGQEIHGRAYDAAGEPLGESFRIDGGRLRNTDPQVSVAENGTFVVVWEHVTRQPSIFARRFALP